MADYTTLKKELREYMRSVDLCIEFGHGTQKTDMMLFDVGQMVAYRNVMTLIERLENEEK